MNEQSAISDYLLAGGFMFDDRNPYEPETVERFGLKYRLIDWGRS